MQLKFSHVLILAIFLTSAKVSCKFSCNYSNLANSSYPRCVTNVTHFSQAIHQRERGWTSGNEAELLPPWIDVPLVVKGQQFAIDHVAGVVQAHLYGIAIILSNPHLRDTLLFTGNSNTVKKSGKRYAATLVQVALWVRRALEQPAAAASAGNSNSNSNTNWVLTSIANVRRIHNHVALRLNRELQLGNYPSNYRNDYMPINTQLWTDFQRDLDASGLASEYPLVGNLSSNLHPMNQLTFATTQWAFLGLILMNPGAVNVFYPTDQGLEAFSHFWAVIGYSMGIQDEYNLGLANNSQDLQKLSRAFFSSYIAPHLFNLSHESKFLMEVFVKSATRIVVGTDAEYILRGILRDVVGIPIRHMNARRGLYAKLVDFVVGPLGPWIAHRIFPFLDWIISPIASLYHFVVGFAYFGLKYRSDQDIAKYCYFYDYDAV